MYDKFHQMLTDSATYLGQSNCNLKCMLQSASSYLYENNELDTQTKTKLFPRANTETLTVEQKTVF